MLFILFSCKPAPDYSLSDADLEYFENFWPKIEEAWNAGEREPYIIGHENSNYMVPHSQTLSSPSDIRSFVEEFPDCTTQYSDFEIRGNQGLVAVSAKFAVNNMEGRQMDKGKFVALFERAGSGDWEMTHAIWNSDLPMPDPASEGGGE